MRTGIMSLVITAILSVPAYAVDTTVTYSSGLLVLLFVGFCALIIVAQLVPALMILFGAMKSVQPRQRHKIKA